MEYQNRPPQETEAAEALPRRSGSGLGGAIMAILLFVGRPFRPLLAPFHLIGKGLTGLIGLAIYWWAFAVIFIYSTGRHDGVWGGFRAARDVEAISFLDGYTTVFLSWPILLLGLVILLVAMEMDPERGGLIDALISRLSLAVYMASWILAGLLFVVSTGYTFFTLPFAMAGGRGLELLLSGPFTAIGLASGLLVGLHKLTRE